MFLRCYLFLPFMSFYILYTVYLCCNVNFMSRLAFILVTLSLRLSYEMWYTWLWLEWQWCILEKCDFEAGEQNSAINQQVPGTESRQRTEKASQGQLPAAHPLHEPHSHQGEGKVGPGGRSGQPDGLLDIANARHLQNGRTVVPESKKEEVKAKMYPHRLVFLMTRWEEAFTQMTYMTVFIPDSCWNIWRPQPTIRARRVGPWRKILKITIPSENEATKNLSFRMI